MEFAKVPSGQNKFYLSWPSSISGAASRHHVRNVIKCNAPPPLPRLCSVLTPTFIVVGHNLASFSALDIVQPMRTLYYTQCIRPKSNVITDNSCLFILLSHLAFHFYTDKATQVPIPKLTSTFGFTDVPWKSLICSWTEDTWKQLRQNWENRQCR